MRRDAKPEQIRRLGTAGAAARRARPSAWALLLIVVPVLVGAGLEIARAASAPTWIIIGLLITGGVVAAIAQTFGPHAATPERSPNVGQLSIDAVDVSYPDALDDDEGPSEGSLVRLDVKATNVGQATVLVNRGRMTVLAVEREGVWGYQDASAEYHVDVGPLVEVGQQIEFPMSQSVGAGGVDRFFVDLVASRSAGEIRTLTVRLELISNFGETAAPQPIAFRIVGSNGEPFRP